MKIRTALIAYLATGASALAQGVGHPCINDPTTTCITILHQAGTQSATAGSGTWHLLTQSHGGTVSLVKNLTKHECEFMRDRVLRLPATQGEKDVATAKDKQLSQECAEKLGNITCGDWSTSYIGPGYIESAECFE